MAKVHDMKRFCTSEGCDPRMMSMIAGSYYLPKENKSKPLGEDAHFILEDEDAIGVADGVGGWSRKGIDAGEYSRELMRNAAASVIKIHGSKVHVNPRHVLDEAFSKTQAKGSSTACIITIAGKSLRAVNLGDSGFLVMRGGRVVYTSRTQQHTFNHPYQLGKSWICDRPSMAEEITVPLQSKDVIIAGTDGLFDNVFPKDIEEVVRQCRPENGEVCEPELVASALAEVARRNSLDRNKSTPFAVAAKKAGISYSGGKYDDITVVVAYVVPRLRV